MLPLRTMPADDANALGTLYRQRLRHGLVVCADARRAAYPLHEDFRPEWGCLSIVAVRHGLEEYHFPDRKRTLTVDDDVYLVLDPASRYSYRLRSLSTARCMMVCFPPRMVSAAANAISDELDELPAACPPRIDEKLAPHDALVTPELRRIEYAGVEGAAGPEWHRQQMAVLLARVLETSERENRAVARLPALRSSTRRELARRVAIATDCIHDGYRDSLDLDTLASVAGLSPFHLLRVFKTIHGTTPQEFLQRKRVAVAKRLRATTRLSAGQIAARVGFRSRSSLHRWLRRVDALRAD